MNLRNKANEIKARGEAVRGDYSSKGAPKRLYDYWLDNSPSTKAARISAGMQRENFCHYWRVVFLWSWMLFLGLKFVDFADTHFGKVVLAALAFFAINALVTLPAGPVVGLAILYGFVFGVAGCFAGGLTGRQTREDTATEYSSKETLALRAGFVLGFYTAIPVFFLTFLGLHYPKAVEKTIYVVGALVGVSLFIMLLIAAIIDFGLLGALLGLFTVVGSVALIVGAGIGLGYLVESHQAKAQEKREAFVEKYVDEHGTYPPNEAFAKKPGPVKRFFSGVGDFIVLVAQVVRVNKWKICPLVELDTNK